MKKYVILGYVYGIGGWQTYMANKLKLMQENGWEVYAVSNGHEAMAGEMLPMLRQFENNRVYDISIKYPSELNKKDRVRCLEGIGGMIHYEEGDEVIFEATYLDAFMWAELLAKHFKGRAICVEVSNRFKKYCNTTLDFFRFKEQRGELMMMSKTGLYELFQGYIAYPEIDNNTVSALTQNAFADDGKDYAALLNVVGYDYVIGTVGWLNKGYYQILIDEVIGFCQQHPDKKVQFVVVGKSTNGSIEIEYEQKAQTVDNLKLSLLGSIAPVPSNLVQLFDVSIASYGCALITDKLGIKTIAMHDPEFLPLGVLGYTLTEPPYNTRANHEKTISDMLRDILVDKAYDELPYKKYPVPELEEQKATHLQRISDLSKEIEYYDVESMPNEDVSTKHKLKVLVQRLFGIRVTETVLSYLKL